MRPAAKVPPSPVVRPEPAELPARLLSLRQAALYIGVSFWTLRDWLAAGHLPTIKLPPLRPREGDRAKPTLRRVLIDRRDLDAFVDQLKAGSPSGWRES